MGLELYVDFHWGIKVDKDVIDNLIGNSDAGTHEVSFDSSVLRRAVYNQQESALFLEFTSGRLYRYSDVAITVFRELCSAQSAGSYFNNHIKHEYHFDECISEDTTALRFDSVIDIEAKEGISIKPCCEDNAYLSGICDGYLIGFDGGGSWGPGPQAFGPNDFQVPTQEYDKLRQFCEQYNIPWDEPRWWVYVRGNRDLNE